MIKKGGLQLKIVDHGITREWWSKSKSKLSRIF